jgi:type IV pilus assembly protein PilA
MFSFTPSHTSKTKVLQGFTLIELMVVIGIIGLLLTIAVPSYQNYIAQARVSEGLSLASVAKTTVSINASIGADSINRDIENTPATYAVESITVDKRGVITITYTQAVAPEGSNTLKLIPYTGTGNNRKLLTAGEIPQGTIQWLCSSADIEAIGNETSGTLPTKIAPSECRSGK